MDTKKSKSTFKDNKSQKVDNKIKQQVKDEKNNKPIIVISLVLAIIVAIFAYWLVSKNNDKEQMKPTTDKNDVVEKEDAEEDDIVINEESEIIEYEKEYIKPVKVEKEEEPEVKYYSISYETNGGNDIEPQILTDTEITALVLPIKEGWVFQGWYKDNEFSEEFIFGDVLTEDIKIYAKWGKYVSYLYEQTLFEKENLVAEDEVIPFLSEEKLSEIPEGYVLGWFIEEIDEAGQVISSVEILEGTLLTEEIYSKFDTEEIVLTAKYLEKFNVEFFEDEETIEALYTAEVVEGREMPFTEVALVVTEKFEGIEDFGWYYLDENSRKWNVSVDQKANIGITKFYLDETYKLIYTEEPDEDVVITDEYKTTENGNIILKEENVSKDSYIKEEDIFKPLEKEGYEFIGWFLVDELTGEATEDMFTEETIIDGNKTYVAKWKQIIVEEVIEEKNEIFETPNEENEDAEFIEEENDEYSEEFLEDDSVLEPEDTVEVEQEIVEE